MERKTGKTALVVTAIGVTALLVILLCYYLINAPNNASDIALPDYDFISADQPDEPEETLFAAVTVDNVLRVLQRLAPLEAYHSTVSLEYYWTDGSATKTAHIWNRETAQKLVLSDASGGTSQHILLREDGSWLWYDDDNAAVKLPEKCLSAEDLLGIPDYHILDDKAEILDAAYATLAGADRVNCIYVRWQMAEDYTATCWISLETGLLVRAIIEENGAMVYRMQQTAVDRLLPGDEAYQSQFLLPEENS